MNQHELYSFKFKSQEKQSKCVQFALLRLKSSEAICHPLLCFSPQHSHYHLQGQGGGGGAPRGEGGHHRLGVDGLLPLLRVHAQHGHLRQGQVAGTAAGFNAWACLTNKARRDAGTKVCGLVARVCCPDAEVTHERSGVETSLFATGLPTQHVILD